MSVRDGAQLYCACKSNYLHMCAADGGAPVMYCEECDTHTEISTRSHKGAAFLEFCTVPCPGYSSAHARACVAQSFAARKAAYMERLDAAGQVDADTDAMFVPPCCNCTCDRCMRMPDE